MAKKNCRMTEKERQMHERAVKVRKMTDEQLCAYLDSLEKKELEKTQESHKEPTVRDFIRFLFSNVGSGNGIGKSTVDKISRCAAEKGFVKEE